MSLTPVADVIARNHAVTPDGCWVWQAGMSSAGYGVVWRGQCRYLMAHRVSYELHVGPIPEGLTLDHLCRNRACINPAHLEPVTNRVNVLRGIGLSAQNATKTHCVNGHPFNTANTYWRPDGSRDCRRCKAAVDRRRRQAARIARGEVTP